MKEYAVIKYTEDMAVLTYRRVVQEQAGAYYIPFNQSKYEYDEDDRSGIVTHMCDTLADAQYLATELTRKYPGNKYIISKSLFFYSTQPGPVVIGEFTEKGLVPT